MPPFSSILIKISEISALPEVRHVARSSVHQELMLNRAPYHYLQRVTIADHFSHSVVLYGRQQTATENQCD